MIVRGVDKNGEWMFGKGKSDYKSSTDAIVQSVGTRLKCFLGDCFFAMTEGIDWFNLLGSKNPLALELSVNAQILNTPGVTGIVSSSATLDPATRNLALDFKVNTVFTNPTNTEPILGTANFLLTESGNILTTEDGDSLELG